MLKIVKKEEIKAKDIETTYSLQYEIEEKILKIVRERPLLNLPDIEQYLSQLPSIGAALLAEIIHKIISNIKEDNTQEALAFIYKLVQLQHDPRELRHYLKHKFRLDAELLLYLLWGRREEERTVYLVNLMLDCYTAQLMLSDKQILKLWKKFIANRVCFLQSKELVSARLRQGKATNTGSQKEGFRRVIIPL